MTDADTSVTPVTPSEQQLMEQHVSEQYDSVPETGEDVTTPEELEVTPEPAEGVESTPEEVEAPVDDELVDAELVEVADEPVAEDEVAEEPVAEDEAAEEARSRSPTSSTRWRPSAAS